MNLQALSIQQLKSHAETDTGERMLEGLRNDLIITNRMQFGSLFKHPCRLDAITLLFCTQGKITASVNLKQYEMHAGGVFLGLPIDIIRVDETENVEAHAVIVSESFVREINIDLQKVMPLYMSIRRNPIFYITSEEQLVLRHYYELAQKAIRTDDPNTREIIRGLLTALIYQIITYANKNYETGGSLPDHAAPRNEHTFNNFMTLLREYHTHERNLKFYADKLCITPKYLSLIVKRVSGKSAAEWVDAYVVLEAKNLLKFSDMSIQQIAYHLHFGTQSSFGKFFKQQTGVSPREFIAQ